MTVLVLSKKDLATHPWHEWLADTGEQVALFAERTPASEATLARLPKDAYARVELFDNWKTNGAIELRARALGAAGSITAVVSSSECDVLRASRLRQWFGVDGQLPEAASAFRDKYRTKQLAAGAGLAVPKHALVGTAREVVSFVNDVGLPVVTKPRSGSGGLGVQRHDDVASALAALAAIGNLDGTPQLLIEEQVGGRRVFVDGLQHDGALSLKWATAYDRDVLEVLATRGVLGCAMLDVNEPDSEVAICYTGRLLCAMPSSSTPTAFHVELFLPQGGSPLLCEAHARVGGGRIRDLGRMVYGCDLEREHARAQAGLSVAREVGGSVPLAGFALALRPGGHLLDAPASCPLPGVVEHRRLVDPGASYPPATKVSHLQADCLVEGRQSHEVAARLAAWAAWLGQESSWVDAEQAGARTGSH